MTRRGLHGVGRRHVPRARVRMVAMVCGCTSSATKNLERLPWCCPCARFMASAAAVASSSSDALEMCMPVMSVTSVWKLSSDSRRPWLISAWYGVYDVYHPGFSRMLRPITPGVRVS